MGNVVNLGRARKRKQAADRQRRADENASRHGRTKAEKARERMEQARLRAAVDGARREPASAAADASTVVERLPERSLGEAEPEAADARAPAAPRDDEP